MKNEKTTTIEFGGDKGGMLIMLEPLLHEVGKEALTDHTVADQLLPLFDQMTGTSARELGEIMTFTMLAIKKWNISIEEAKKLILNRNALDWCFQKHMSEGGMDTFFNAPKGSAKH
jgi:hypothetical protein